MKHTIFAFISGLLIAMLSIYGWQHWAPGNITQNPLVPNWPIEPTTFSADAPFKERSNFLGWEKAALVGDYLFVDPDVSSCIACRHYGHAQIYAYGKNWAHLITAMDSHHEAVTYFVGNIVEVTADTLRIKLRGAKYQQAEKIQGTMANGLKREALSPNNDNSCIFEGTYVFQRFKKSTLPAWKAEIPSCINKNKWNLCTQETPCWLEIFDKDITPENFDEKTGG